ncbi:GATA transcription factor 25 [Solanum tuberosum]|uniref:GATA transcription factor 25 n=1 Tax=Solanum tuberosum TaxID=4113 RepID=UPI00073A4F94|nr:PREDICTED: GATA transcription factor 25 [Solanum tuberosum]
MNVDKHFSGAGEEVSAGNDVAVGNFPVGYGGGVGSVKVTMPHYTVCSASDVVALQNREAKFDQLTISFRGKIYVFDGVTTHKIEEPTHEINDQCLWRILKVHSLFQLLGGYEYCPGTQALGLSSANQKDYVDHPVHCADPKRLESLIRFYEKRKKRCYEKKIRYGIRQEVAFRMKRKNGLFARKGSTGPKQDDIPSEETRYVFEYEK